MNKGNYIIGVLITIFSLASCTNSIDLKPEKEAKQSLTKTDSAELTSLVRNLYEWHVTKEYSSDFPYKFQNPNDSIFTGIDWDAYAKNIEVLKKTSFFSKYFFTNHKTTALRIDSSIKGAKVEWRNINDGISLWNTDADDWCGCQDYPDKYWKTLTLNEFRFRDDSVTFNWTWGNENGFQANKYELKARKENGTWKISDLEGFTYYGTVADYNKTMNK